MAHASLGTSDYDQRRGGFELVGEQRDEEPPRPQRRLPAIVLSVAVMALFAGGLWFAYVQGTRHAPAAPQSRRDGVPLIRADDRARPRSSRTSRAACRSRTRTCSLYTTTSRRSPPVEKLLPPPEQPMPRRRTAGRRRRHAPTAGARRRRRRPRQAPHRRRRRPRRRQRPPPTLAQTAPRLGRSRRRRPTAGSGAPAGRAPAARSQVRLGSVRSAGGRRARNGHRLKRENADLLGNLRAERGPRRSRRQGHLLSHPGRAVRRRGRGRAACGELKQRSIGCILAR